MKYAGFDLETPGLKGYKSVIWIMTLFFEGRQYIWNDCYGMTKCPPELRKILEDKNIVKVIASAEFDAPYFELVTGVRIVNIEDVRLQEQVIQGIHLPRWNKKAEMPPWLKKMYINHSSSLKYQIDRYGLPPTDKAIRVQFIDRPKGVPFVKKELEYAAYDSKVVLPIRAAQEMILRRDNLWEVACLENKFVDVITRMKVLGLGFNPTIWRKITLDNQYRHDRLIASLPKTVRNWNSPAQVKEYFHSKGINIPTFDDLDKIAKKANNTELNTYVEARELSTNISKYGLQWLGFQDSDGRIRCGWEQILNTGRCSVSDPPIHGLKKEGNYRAAFVPAKGKVFVIGDYTGQELGIMAAKAKEKIWIDALLREDDVHALTASIVFKNEWKAGTEKGCKFPKKCKCKSHSKYRHYAKTINYMLAYGGGIDKFCASTGHTRVMGASIIGRHSRAVPSVIRFLDRNAQEAVKTQVSYSADPYRRRRVLYETNRLTTQGKNNPIQSAGANMIKLAAVSMPWEFPIVFIWHDEIILEVPKRDAKRAAKVMKEVMDKTASYITGIENLITVKPRIALNLMKDE